MKILAIESSCDETSCAIVQDSDDIHKRILSNVINSQVEIHKKYGGVVPEQATRNHLKNIDTVINEAISASGENLKNIDAIAATTGPGLIGGLIVGSVVAKTMSMCLKKPFMAINHLEGHILSSRIMDKSVQFPHLALLASGGHFFFTEIIDVGNYRILGETLDDAAGEAFDKVARMLGFSYPGGIAIEESAKNGDKNRFKFPIPLKRHRGCNASFSGLKTAVKTHIEKMGQLSKQDICDVAASFQDTVITFIINQLSNALSMSAIDIKNVTITGGVASNSALRAKITDFCEMRKLSLSVPQKNLCSDNAAMIGWCAIERIKKGFPYSALDFKTRPRWPISEI